MKGPVGVNNALDTRSNFAPILNFLKQFLYSAALKQILDVIAYLPCFDQDW